MQQLQFQAFRRHDSPKASVVPVDRQREALVVLWKKTCSVDLTCGLNTKKYKRGEFNLRSESLT